MARAATIAAVVLLAAVAVPVRARFPAGFLFGTSTAAYQVEGGYDEGGRTPSIWDAFVLEPNRIAGNATGDVADDDFHRFEEDVQLMAALGVTGYRFSISWSRVMRVDGSANPDGVKHYHELLDALERHHITPLVTLYHWDLPLQYSEMINSTAGYDGFLNGKLVDAFVAYADLCFREYGARVRHWITFNEPLSICRLGYGTGGNAPGRCSDRNTCAQGNSTTEPYICAHNLLLAHAHAAQHYRQHYAPAQKGVIGLATDGTFAEPYTQSAADVAAAERSMVFALGWFNDPTHFGDYPKLMRELVGDRLPRFTDEQKRVLRGSVDFIGFNHYTSRLIADNPAPLPVPSPGWDADQRTVEYTAYPNGTAIGPQAASDWLWVVPWGFPALLRWLSDRYHQPAIYVTENGVDVPGEDAMPLAQALNDTFRVAYLSAYTAGLQDAIADGVDVRGYFLWSLLDNFEWADGYSKRFGIHYVDYANGLKRYPKHSAQWYAQFIAANKPDAEPDTDAVADADADA